MQQSRHLRVRSAVVYAAAMLLASAYCVFHSISAIQLALGVATLSVMSAAAIGYALGGWYLSVGSDRSTFELVAVHVVVFFGAPLVGASIFLLAGAVFSQPGAGEDQPLGILLAVPMTIAYISLTWPVALFSFAAAGIAMARFSRRGSNNSFKPSPPRYGL